MSFGRRPSALLMLCSLLAIAVGYCCWLLCRSLVAGFGWRQSKHVLLVSVDVPSNSGPGYSDVAFPCVDMLNEVSGTHRACVIDRARFNDEVHRWWLVGVPGVQLPD